MPLKSEVSLKRFPINQHSKTDHFSETFKQHWNENVVSVKGICDPDYLSGFTSHDIQLQDRVIKSPKQVNYQDFSASPRTDLISSGHATNFVNTRAVDYYKSYLNVQKSNPTLHNLDEELKVVQNTESDFEKQMARIQNAKSKPRKILLNASSQARLEKQRSHM